MGYLARLSDGSTLAPAVEVLAGNLTARQANRTYRGITGTCPHCEALRDAQHGTDNARIREALACADLSVRYVSAALEAERMTRVPHFAHRRGFLQTDAACLLCRNADLAHHAAVVKVLGRWAQRTWPGATVAAELTVTLPGTPPQQFRPDVAVHDANGAPLACIEYQRSPEGFEAFQARHELRLRQFPTVLWFFARGAYQRSGNHRAHLHELGHAFYVCWPDRDTGELHVEPGRPMNRDPDRRSRHELNRCSEASLIRAMEARADEPRLRQEPTVDTTRDLVMHSAPAPRRIALPVQERPSIIRPTVALQLAMTARGGTGWPVGSGRPIRVHGEPGWTLPGRLPSAGGANVLCIDPAGESRLIRRRHITL